MTKQKKLFLGILTFLPLLCVVIYIICLSLYMFSFVKVLDAQAGDPNVADPSPFLAFFGIMFIMIFLAIVLSIGLLIYYIVHANNNPKFDSNQKLMWILVLVFASGIGNMVYYFVAILPEEKPSIGAS